MDTPTPRGSPHPLQPPNSNFAVTISGKPLSLEDPCHLDFFVSFGPPFSSDARSDPWQIPVDGHPS